MKMGCGISCERSELVVIFIFRPRLSRNEAYRGQRKRPRRKKGAAVSLGVWIPISRRGP